MQRMPQPSHHHQQTRSSNGGKIAYGGGAATESASSKRNHGRGFLSLQNMLSHGLVGIVCLYVGLLIGMSGSMGSTTTSSSSTTTTTLSSATMPDCSLCPSSSWVTSPSLSSRQDRRRQVFLTPSSSLNNNNNNSTNHQQQQQQQQRQSPFPKTLDKMLVDFATVPRDDFNKMLEIGVPLDDTVAGAEEVTIIYTSTKSMPYGKGVQESKFGLDAKKALENCHTVKVILQEPSRRRKTEQCLAIVPQWESYAVHKFMRMPQNIDGMPKNGKNAKDFAVDLKLPLRYVSRSYDDKGRHAGVPVISRHTVPSYGILVEYLQNLDRLLADLKPFLKNVMGKADAVSRGIKNPSRAVSRNTLVVSVCNKGQAPLFRNFVCNARAKGLDLSHLVMFATDAETLKMCQDLGIAAWYDETIFGSMPETAARSYGDRTFTKMMLAKVYCVHLVLSCGYNVLFQDVDVVWYKNPLPYFDSKDAEEWDMMFQDDGARTIRYQPYSPNTGFYFVRNSPLTQFFFSLLLRMGDVVALNKSHQAALTGLVNEFVSWKGLRVKVWKWGEKNQFPGGVEFHRNKGYMQKMLSNKLGKEQQPYIFHMSWTTNKDNKLLFLQQIGEWYTKSEAGTILTLDSGCNGVDCCLAEPDIICHYRDKPSKIPCKDSPPIDKGKRSFW